MLKINFLPDSDRKDLVQLIDKGISEYKEIWENDSKKIIDATENVSGLSFVESEINAIIYVSRSLSSRSFPLSLRADLPLDIKKGLIVHELCHRLLSGNHVRVKTKERKDLSLEIHKVLNLILYDIWVEVYNEKLADKMVEWESSSRKGLYKEAWDWALAIDKKERKKKFRQIIRKQG